MTDQDILTSSAIDQAQEKARRRRAIAHAEEIKTFVGSSPYREHFVNRKPATKHEEEYFDTVETLIDVVEKYFDESFFTEHALKAQFMLCRQADAKGKREGILVKQHPYSGHTTINIFGVAEACYDVLEKFLDGKQLGTIIRFRGLPSQAKLIDYLCVKDLLEKQPPDGLIQSDTGDLPYWSIHSFKPPAIARQLDLFGQA